MPHQHELGRGVEDTPPAEAGASGLPRCLGTGSDWPGPSLCLDVALWAGARRARPGGERACCHSPGCSRGNCGQRGRLGPELGAGCSLFGLFCFAGLAPLKPITDELLPPSDGALQGHLEKAGLWTPPLTTVLRRLISNPPILSLNLIPYPPGSSVCQGTN